MRYRLFVGVFTALALASSAASAHAAIGPPQTDPNGVINLPTGFSYTIVAEACIQNVRSTESGTTFPNMPTDWDANVAFQAPGGKTWLLSNHELTQPRAGDFQGDAGKCHVDEQTAGDNDSNGWGSVSRLTLAKDGTTVISRELITTGLHNLCAGAQTPWQTYLTNEEFPFIVDPTKTSGWVWEIDPATGAQHRATGMGRFSHEQEARAAGDWYLTDDRGDFQYLYRYEPSSQRDLVNGTLWGLYFNRATLTGYWVGPLNPLTPEADMISRVGAPNATNSFSKAEGIIAAHSGNAVVFSESASGSNAGRVWELTDLNHAFGVHGRVLAEGDFARMSRPDNLRMNDAGDLFIMEDNGSALGNPLTGGVNQIWLLPRRDEGSAALIHFATLPDGEPTGPWFNVNNHLLYLSIQDQQTATTGSDSRVIAISHGGATFNRPYTK